MKMDGGLNEKNNAVSEFALTNHLRSTYQPLSEAVIFGLPQMSTSTTFGIIIWN